MECRNLEIFGHSATDLKELNLIEKMDPYVSVTLSGDPNSKQKMEVNTDGGKNPKWKGKPMKFVINEDLAKCSNVTLVFKIMAEKLFGDKDVDISRRKQKGDSNQKIQLEEETGHDRA
ncbi:hypothetical protein QQ045_020864 [Rhodiola kirilowii]